MDIQDALSDCLILNTVAAARGLLRQHDALLKPYGVTVQQFALMGALRIHPGEPVASLAQKILLDRTSLTRNLDLLERKQLVGRIADTSGNVRLCALTKEGNALLDQLVVVWQATRTGLENEFAPAEIETYLRVAKHIAKRMARPV